MRPPILFLCAAAAWAAIPTSPRISQLQDALRLKQAGALEAFWSDVAQKGGTPLIECPADLAPDCLITFLWRGDSSTRNVVVLGEAMPGEPAENLFHFLDGSDVWYRTYRFRKDARFMYMLSINDPLTSWDVEGPERQKRYAGVHPDPLNKDGYVSLPGAPSERWIQERAGVAHGEVREAKVPEAGQRGVEIYASPGFRPKGITPVLVFFDGPEAKDLSRVPIILDNLLAERRIPPLLAAFISQPYERREADLACNEDTSRFVVEQLLPWLRREYKIRTAPRRTILAGASLGSLAATFAALRHPDAVGGVLSQSGAFWWGPTEARREWLTEELKSRPRVKVKFYFDVGLMETRGGPLSQLNDNRRLADVLRRKGYTVVYREFNGPHAYVCWRAALADALQDLLGRPGHR